MTVDNPLQWAIGRLLEAGIENPRLEAQLLLALALNLPRVSIVAETYSPPDPSRIEAFRTLISLRCDHIPLPYLRETQEFYGLEFVVTPAVLIPRPETEMLVDFAREIFPPESEHTRKRQTFDSSPLLADVGTGSGCIVTASLVHCPSVQGVAIELSAEALQVARGNAVRHGIANRLRLFQGNVLSGLRENRFDLILSNPPYIPSQEIAFLAPEVGEQEPRLALDGGADGLTILRKLADESFSRLRPGGWLAVEVARGQAAQVSELFDQAGFCSVGIRTDLAGIERVVTGRRF